MMKLSGFIELKEAVKPNCTMSLGKDGKRYKVFVDEPVEYKGKVICRFSVRLNEYRASVNINSFWLHHDDKVLKLNIKSFTQLFKL